MRTTISVRHCEVADTLRERARAVTGRLGQLSPHALAATVVFDKGSLAQAVEIRLQARGRRTLVGLGEGPDHRTALDRAEEKLRSQLVKAAGTRRRTRRNGTRASARPT